MSAPGTLHRYVEKAFEIWHSESLGSDAATIAECRDHDNFTASAPDSFHCLSGRGASIQDVFNHNHLLAFDLGVIAALDHKTVAFFVRIVGADLPA